MSSYSNVSGPDSASEGKRAALALRSGVPREAVPRINACP